MAQKVRPGCGRLCVVAEWNPVYRCGPVQPFLNGIFLYGALLQNASSGAYIDVADLGKSPAYGGAFDSIGG